MLIIRLTQLGHGVKLSKGSKVSWDGGINRAVQVRWKWREDEARDVTGNFSCAPLTAALLRPTDAETYLYLALFQSNSKLLRLVYHPSFVISTHSVLLS